MLDEIECVFDACCTFIPGSATAKFCKVHGCKARFHTKGGLPASEEDWINREASKFTKPREFKTLRITKAPDGFKVLIVNDTQFPFADYKTLLPVGKFWNDFAPDLEIYNGDTLDFYGCSDFSKNPSRLFNLQDEIDETHRWLAGRAEANPDARRILIQGNHEDRLRRWLWKKGPELSSLRSLEFDSLLRLDELKMESLPYMSAVDFLGYRVEHGWKASGGDTPYPINVSRYMATKTGSSGLCGHTHRASVYCWTNASGTHSYTENGCLCSMESMEYAANPNWQQAFSIGTVWKGKLHTQLVQIYPDGFAVNGEWYARGPKG